MHFYCVWHIKSIYLTNFQVITVTKVIWKMCLAMQELWLLVSEVTLSHWDGALNVFYWYQILALDSFVVKTQILFNSHGGLITYVMHHHRVIIYSDKTKKKAHDSQIVRAKENLKLSHGEPSYQTK